VQARHYCSSVVQARISLLPNSWFLILTTTFDPILPFRELYQHLSQQCHPQLIKRRSRGYAARPDASRSVVQADPVQALYFGLAAVVVAFGVYTIWGEQLFPSSSTSSTSSSVSSAKEKAKSLTGQAKQKLYSPKGGTSS
jgi:hypothetical protein